VYRRQDRRAQAVGFCAVGKRYKLFWCGCQEKTESAAEKWVDHIIIIDTYNKRIIMVNLVAGDRIINNVSIYDPHSDKSDKEKGNFWNLVFQIVNRVSMDEMLVILVGDMSSQVYITLWSYRSI